MRGAFWVGKRGRVKGGKGEGFWVVKRGVLWVGKGGGVKGRQRGKH